MVRITGLHLIYGKHDFFPIFSLSKAILFYCVSVPGIFIEKLLKFILCQNLESSEKSHGQEILQHVSKL